MQAIAELVLSKEDWLIQRVLASARRLGYSRYTSTLLEAWRASIQGLSSAFIASLESEPTPFDFTPDFDPVQDPVAYFGIIEAQRHRARGVTLEQFLGLMKYYRQAYLDMLDGRELPTAMARRGRQYMERFFDRMEMGICSEWANMPKDRLLDDLRRANRAITNEKNRLLTIIESLPFPTLFFDSHGRPQHFNHAAAALLDLGRNEAGIPCMAPHVEEFLRGALASKSRAGTSELECPVPTREGLRPMLVRNTPMLDVSGKFSGVLLTILAERAASLPAPSDLAMLPDSEAGGGGARPRRQMNLQTDSWQRFQELTLLYRVSSTMLTTIRLDKLIHLILTALTAGDAPSFDRAMLFLANERSGFMQGMLGVTRETSAPLGKHDLDPADVLGASWDLSEEVMLRQQESEFSRRVRGSRLELDGRRNLFSQAVKGKRLIFVRDAGRIKVADPLLMERLGIASFAVAPLIAKEKVFGVVLVDNALTGRPIGKGELGFLQIFTNQAGVAIENAMLYSRLEEANRNLREAQERLIHGERLATIGEMAAGLVHELKGPLVSIGGFASRLLKSLPASGAQHDSADMIAREVQRLDKLLGGILAFGRKTTLCFDQYIVQDLLDDALAVIAITCAEQQIVIQRAFPKKPVRIIADGQQLKQVFLNLFFNAQDVMSGKGGGRLSVSVASARMRGCPAVVIRVADTGGGVSDYQLHNLFAPFFTTKESGTGLGLPIAHRIVTNHRGTMQVNNLETEGLEFVITLPLQQQ